ncbi:hypothetical protein [Pyrobaculum islandicum]|uniref:hypothetical protein n=1 Tax=Pyrobaculum islandicum TaxID=2277 RepID=UPI00069DA67F|nr:hypothetical protein [Pyrobaculum islandicum]
MGGLKNGFTAIIAVSAVGTAVGIAGMNWTWGRQQRRITPAGVNTLLMTTIALVAAKISNMAGTRLSTPGKKGGGSVFRRL